MQFNQPGFFNYGQPFTFNNPYQFNGYPEVVGEGNVTSVLSPDGSMQLLFLPTTQWWRPYPCNINAGNVNNTNWNPTGAWFIRSVFSPTQPMPCQAQPFQAPSPSGIAFPRTYSSDCCVTQPACPPPNFELKFHNDICTSTSDIHCFYPSLRPCDWLKKPKGCASVQVDAPMLNNSVYHHEIICTKPCHCSIPMDQTENTAKVKCRAQKSQTSFSDTSMSCDTDKSGNDCSKDTGKKARKEKKKPKHKKKTKSKVKCECGKQKTSEKCVSTLVDQACGSVEDRGRETQTNCGKGQDTQTICEIVPLRKASSGSTCGNEIKAEIWNPKTQRSKRAIKTKSSGNFSGVCESGCCSGTCSCHDSCTDSRDS